jgi:putative heme-binding domain-containing protein
VIGKASVHPDSNVRVLYERFVPESDRPRRLGGSISPAEILSLTGDASRGRKIFNKSSAANCKQCHAIAGFGGSLGPDLGTIGKKYERGALLETILDPSKAIAPEFIPYVLETTTGQVYAGFVVERTADHLLIKDVKSRDIRVEAGEVEALVPQKKSLMPELVLSEITAQDAADLLAFLTTLK